MMNLGDLNTHQAIWAIALGWAVVSFTIFFLIFVLLDFIGVINIREQARTWIYGTLIVSLVGGISSYAVGILTLSPSNVASQIQGQQVESALNAPFAYIHVANKGQMIEAQQLQSRLRQQGFAVPSVRNVGPDASPQTMEVRYFHESNSSQANKAADIVKPGLGAIFLKGYEKAPVGQIDIFFPRT
jgi:hypothetical protein